MAEIAVDVDDRRQRYLRAGIADGQRAGSNSGGGDRVVKQQRAGCEGEISARADRALADSVVTGEGADRATSAADDRADRTAKFVDITADQAAIDERAKGTGNHVAAAGHRAAVVEQGDDGVVLDGVAGASDHAAVGQRADRAGIQDRPAAVADRAGVDQLADAALVPQRGEIGVGDQAGIAQRADRAAVVDAELPAAQRAGVAQRADAAGRRDVQAGVGAGEHCAVRQSRQRATDIIVVDRQAQRIGNRGDRPGQPGQVVDRHRRAGQVQRRAAQQRIGAGQVIAGADEGGLDRSPTDVSGTADDQAGRRGAQIQRPGGLAVAAREVDVAVELECRARVADSPAGGVDIVVQNQVA